MDAPAWLGLEPTHNPMGWMLPITPGISASQSTVVRFWRD